MATKERRINYKEVYGDLIELAQQGKFEVLVNECNCLCTMKEGIAPKIARVYGCDDFPMEHEAYSGDINKLGQIDFAFRKGVFLANCYTQYGTKNDRDKTPGDYEALTLCLRKLNYLFKGKQIGLSRLGCDSGLEWDTVKQIIEEELKDMDITIVNSKSKE